MAHLLFFLIVLSISTYLGTCGPLSWQTNNIEPLERYERDAGSGEDPCSDVGSGGIPYSDDEDSPCDVTAYTRPSHPAPRIRSLHVETTITARYVSTTVTTEIQNHAPLSQDSDFTFRLSKGAFISDFFMVINGEQYQSEVREKQQAQKAYNEARRQGLTAGQVKQSENDLSKFETNVNLSPNTTATFHLSFQELLRRKNGVFQHKVNLYPKEVVRHLRADVYITEPQGISFANISWVQDDSLTTDFLYDALTVNQHSDTRVHALFTPSHEDQEGLAATGLQGDLVITYDVVHDSGAGHIEIVNGYFVHHISPEGLPQTPKNVIFVIDISGSMNSYDGIYGSKLDQTKLAMATIIDDIRSFDHFNIICFSDTITRWRNDVVEATPENKIGAKTFVDRLQAYGGTDIHGGLMDAITQLKSLDQRRDISNRFSMIIMLTDGQPTSGITDTTDIVRRVTIATDYRIAIFSLAFGKYADYKLLQKLSGHNQGLARKIYTDSNPSLQLTGFYNEVATPLLHNIDVMYPDDAVDLGSLTKSNFISYFEGTELVIAGKIKEDYKGNELSAVVVGHSFDVQLEWELTKTIQSHSDDEDPVLKPHQVSDFAQRLWAYVTIKDLLSQLDIALTYDKKNSIRDTATQIALRYRFVTPLTSLIVIKPEDDQNYDDIVDSEIDDGDSTDHANSQDQLANIPSRHAPVYVQSSAPARHQPTMSVDGDPHVFVDIPDQNTTICFEIKGENGMMINILRDEKLGININAVMLTISEAPEDEPKSFFSTFGVTLENHAITVTPWNIQTEEGFVLDWKTKSRMAFHNFILRVEPAEKILEIYNMKGVSMYIKRHSDLRIKKNGSQRENHVDHLGLYFQESTGFTETLSGILGQFYSSTHEFHIEPMAEPENIPDQDFTKVANLVADGTKTPVVWLERPHHTCWHADSDGGGYLDPILFKTDRLF